MTQTPKISVIIAAYKASDTLPGTIASIQAQTEKDMEIIIIDDTSPDDTLKVAQKLAESDERIKVIARETNGGPAGARNTGLDAAQGEWMVVVDADDLIEPERFTAMLDGADTYQADIVFDNLFYIPANSPDEKKLYIPQDMDVFGSLSLKTYIESHRGRSPIPNLGFTKPMIRRSVIEANNMRYNTTLKIGEDALFIMQLMAKGTKACLLKQAYYQYFRHEGSISFTQNAASVKAINSAFTEFRMNFSDSADPQALKIMDALIEDNYWRIQTKEMDEAFTAGEYSSVLRISLRHGRNLKWLIRRVLGKLLKR